MTTKDSGSSSAQKAAPIAPKAAKANDKANAGQAAGAVRSRPAKVAAAKKAAPRRATVAAKASAAKADKPAEKPKKLKLVRDSFTMPEAEYAEIAATKKRLLAQGTAAKKSEILRAAIRSFAALKDADLIKAIGQLEPIKTGRPAKAKK
jgi:hypothetical protein